MFDLSIGKIVVLLLAALFVLGPDRLPAAAAWLGRAIRQVKGLVAGANEQLRSELGPELDQLREPLAELRAPLQELRALRDPRTAVMRHLFSDAEAVSGPSATTGAGIGGVGAGAPLAPDEKPPIDVDAT